MKGIVMSVGGVLSFFFLVVQIRAAVKSPLLTASLVLD